MKAFQGLCRRLYYLSFNIKRKSIGRIFIIIIFTIKASNFNKKFFCVNCEFVPKCMPTTRTVLNKLFDVKILNGLFKDFRIWLDQDATKQFGFPTKKVIIIQNKVTRHRLLWQSTRKFVSRAMLVTSKPNITSETYS